MTLSNKNVCIYVSFAHLSLLYFDTTEYEHEPEECTKLVITFNEVILQRQLVFLQITIKLI